MHFSIHQAQHAHMAMTHDTCIRPISLFSHIYTHSKKIYVYFLSYTHFRCIQRYNKGWLQTQIKLSQSYAWTHFYGRVKAELDWKRVIYIWLYVHVTISMQNETIFANVDFIVVGSSPCTHPVDFLCLKKPACMHFAAGKKKNITFMFDGVIIVKW